eukprot:gene21405-24281_t
MFATRFGARVQKQAVAQFASRSASSLPTTLYQNVWRKSNVLYITYVATGCLVLGSIYGSVVSFIWEANNRGKLYHHIDWTKFKSEDDDEE